MVLGRFKKTLSFVCSIFEKNNITWTLIGSVSLCLRGMKLKPNDLDIIVAYCEIKKVKNILKNFDIIKEKQLPNNEGVSVLFLIKEVEVEICFEKDDGLYFQYIKKNKPDIIKWGNLKIPCIKITDKAEIYKKLKREEKAKLINEFIKNENKRD